MAHIELRPLDDDDVDAVFEMMRDPEAVRLAAFTAQHPDDRPSFDEWMSRHRTAPDIEFFAVTENGGFAGTAALFTVDGEREVTYWLARHAWGRGIATAALRLLIAFEAERPLFARVASHNLASLAVLEKNGFTEVSRTTSFAPGLGREAEERLYALLPAIDGY
ncbi:MAG: GNAT family N-acetyltransferase [Microbacterium sp.]|uniref:GNAT family N-acetyltransferase n=1 Tax=Microbacterium sp. TaxID=51671 RepID=UPI000DB2684C|nr:GNAT family N-acetyltransferase [Microbacterium sp.]PZU39195.1 MAG: GNAT family N-acetyltransferase [Microbacterium sp.]